MYRLLLVLHFTLNTIILKISKSATRIQIIIYSFFYLSICLPVMDSDFLFPCL